MSALFITSLRNRVRAMNTLWERAAHEMTPAQVNHHERPGVLPIAFSFSHVMRVQDEAISTHFFGEQALWVQDSWARRIGVSVDRSGRGEPVGEMERLQFADFDAWRAYQSAVVARTARALEGLTEEDLAAVAIPLLPAAMEGSYCSLVVGMGNPVRKLDVLECFVYQHGLRHMGEVEHGRAFVGLGGMTG
jgi:hypothetical protein